MVEEQQAAPHGKLKGGDGHMGKGVGGEKKTRKENQRMLERSRHIPLTERQHLGHLGKKKKYDQGALRMTWLGAGKTLDRRPSSNLRSICEATEIMGQS